MSKNKLENFDNQKYSSLYFWLLQNKNLVGIPEDVKNEDIVKIINSIKVIDVDIVTGSEIPVQIDLLINLEEFRISSFSQDLKNSLGEVSEFKQLRIPETIGNFSKLNKLLIKSESLEVIVPKSIERLKNLSELALNIPMANQVPESINKLSNLHSLSLSSKGLFPTNLKQLINLESLVLKVTESTFSNQNDFLSYLAPIKDLANLKTLIIEAIDLKILPEWISNYKKLEYLSSKNLSLGTLPSFLKKLNNLKHLSLNNCELSEIPSWISELNNLIEIHLCGNQIYELPYSMQKMENLRYVYLDRELVFMLVGEPFEELKKALPPRCKIELIKMNNHNEKPSKRNNEYLELYQWLLHNGWVLYLKENLSLKEIKNELANIEKLTIDDTIKENIPVSIKLLTNLKKIWVGDYHKNLIDNLGSFIYLEELIIWTTIKYLPSSIGKLTKLERLEIQSDSVELPDTISFLISLRDLTIISQIKSLPENIGNLENLSKLILKSTTLGNIPSSLGKLHNLVELTLHIPNATSVLESFSLLSNLKHLDVAFDSTLPANLGQFTSLESLTLIIEEELNILEEDFHYSLSSIISLSSLKKLHLSSPNLKSLPEWLGVFEKLEYFSSRNLKCYYFPPFLRKLKNLKDIHLQYCGIGEIPEWISELEDLIILDLTGNDIYQLPTNMKEMKKLQEVRLSEQVYFALLGSPIEYEAMQAAIPPKCKLLFI